MGINNIKYKFYSSAIVKKKKKKKKKAGIIPIALGVAKSIKLKNKKRK